MSIPQAPRRGSENPRRVHFAYVGTEKGGSWDAHTAGPAMWFDLHSSWKSKPCLETMTKGELSCAICGTGHIASVKGYVPLYRSTDGKPVCVVVDEVHRDATDRLPFLTRVLVGRERTRGSGTWVTRAPVQTPAYQSTLPERQRPADLTDTLLRMWAIPELVFWYRQTHGISGATAALPPGVAIREDGSQMSPALQAAAKRAGFPVDDSTNANELFAQTVKGLQERASKNGKHAPPKS